MPGYVLEHFPLLTTISNLNHYHYNYNYNLDAHIHPVLLLASSERP